MAEFETTNLATVSNKQSVKRTQSRLSPGACCEICGRNTVSRLPTFSVGSGISARSMADDIYCRYCGHIGLPEWKSAE